MNIRFFTPPETTDPKIRSAFRYISIVMVATFTALLLEVYLAIRSGAWQLWGTASFVLLVFGAAIIGRRLVLTGKTERAAQLLIYSVLLTVVTTPFFIAGIGISLASASVVLIVVFASRTTQRPERYIITSFVVAALTIFLELSLPSYRLVVEELKIFVPVATVGILVILIYMTVRGFGDYSLRTKMIIVIVTVVMISIATIAFLTSRSLSENLTTSVGANMSALANSKAVEIARTVEREVRLHKALEFDSRIQSAARLASAEEPLSDAEIERLDSRWRVAFTNNDNSELLVARVLFHHASTQLHKFQAEFPEQAEIFLTDQQGLNVASTHLTSDYYQGDEEWWQVANRDGLYIGQPEYDESSKVMAVIIATSIRDEASGNIIGVLRTTINLEGLAYTLGSGSFGKTGRTELYLPNRQEVSVERDENGSFSIAVEESGFDINSLQTEAAYFQTTHHEVPVLASQARVTGTDKIGKDTAASDLNWRVIVYQDLTEARQPVDRQTRGIVILALFIFVVSTFVALGLAQIISGPMIRLNAVAERVAAGDLLAQAVVETGDETGTLARTFNSMTGQLRDLIGTLEIRVAERTKALATSAEVSRHLSTILNERQLIVDVVEQLKAAFDYYHVHIYMRDETSGDLIMAGGTGDVGAAMLGSGHRVPKGKGLVGRAALNNVPVLVSDTTREPNWLPNPLLPETRSEAAVPIATAGKVLGVLDVQHNVTDGLKQEDVALLQSLANQIAIALQNARSYVDIQQRAEREARVISIGTKIKSMTTIEGALQAAARELGRTLNTNDIRVILEAPGLPQNGQKPD